MATEQIHGDFAYDPETYWSARATECCGLTTICVRDATEIENRCADHMQQEMLAYALHHESVAGKDVLEYGCGLGRWATFFADRNAVWTGADISEAMLRRAGELHPDTAFVLTENNHIPAEDNSFDLAYSVTVVHHNPYGQQERIISEMTRVLRGNGRLILMESIDPRRRFNMFPRPIHGWLELLRQFGMHCVYRRTFRSRILRDVCKVIGRRVASAVGRQTERRSDHSNDRVALWRKVIGPSDTAFDRFLLPLLPRQFHDQAVMVFQRRQSSSGDRFVTRI